MSIKLGNDLLPSPPVETVFNESVANLTTGLFLLSGLILVIYGLRKPEQRIIVVAMLTGGAITSLIEPFLDVAGGAWHPSIGQPVAFSLAARDIPYWVIACYAVFYGAIGSLNLFAFMKGISRLALWLWFLVPISFDFFIEEMMLHWDLYYYYGNQPLILLWEFPWYQAACNSTGEFIGISVLYFLRPYLTKGWMWFPATIIVLPLCGTMGFLGVGLPSFYAVNTSVEMSAWATQLCGVATWALACLVVFYGSLFIVRKAESVPPTTVNT